MERPRNYRRVFNCLSFDSVLVSVSRNFQKRQELARLLVTSHSQDIMYRAMKKAELHAAKIHPSKRVRGLCTLNQVEVHEEVEDEDP